MQETSHDEAFKPETQIKFESEFEEGSLRRLKGIKPQNPKTPKPLYFDIIFI